VTDFSDLRAPGVWALASQYRTGALSPVDVVDAALARMAEAEPSLNAVANPMAEAALAEAAQRADELRTGTDLGPLHGIPVAIKDLIEVRGAPTGYGTRVEAPHIAEHDAALVANLRAAGAIIFPKTNLLEYAYGVAHPDVGQTNNPHDPHRTAGGSSGGSAAVVAAGIVPLAVGTDTGGSIRIPAAYCGIVGLKPSYGLVPLDGVFPLAQSLDHAGPLARSVTDAALMLAAMSGRPVPLSAVRPEGLRIGVLRAHFPKDPANLPVGAAVDAALARLAAAGAIVTDLDIPGLDAANGQLMTILGPEASVIHKSRLATNPDGYAADTRSQIEDGFKTPAADYVAARQFQGELRAAVDTAFAEVDVLLSPSVPFVAPFEDPIIADGGDSELLASGFANVSGHPSINLPCGYVDGLPVGLQLTGRSGQDAELLSVSRAVEALLA